MTCIYCGGRVEWQGRLTNLTHTKCLCCGAMTCQVVEDDSAQQEAGTGGAGNRDPERQDSEVGEEMSQTDTKQLNPTQQALAAAMRGVKDDSHMF